MKRIKLVLLPLVVAGLSFGIAACGDDDDDDGGGGGTSLDLVIGDLVPLTGDLDAFGPGGEKAATVAADEINAAIEEAGADHTVEVLHEDDQTDPQAATQAARQMLGEGATCIAGSWASGATIPVFESVSSREEILQISPASTSDDITEIEDDGLLNRTAPADRNQAIALADAMEAAVGIGTVNIGARNDAYGTGLAEAFTEVWEEAGGSVGETVVYDPEQPSYNTEAEQIVAGNPDAYLFIDFPDPFGEVGAALVRTGAWDPEVTFVSDGLAFPNLPQLIGEDITEGMIATLPGSPNDETAAQEFDEVYTAAPGPDRAPYDAQNFDAVVLCYLAAVAAGSTEGADMAEALPDVVNPPGDEYTPGQLAEAIEALENGDDIDYQGASGPVDLDENGDPTNGVYDIFQYRGRSMEEIEEGAYEDPGA